MKAYRVATAQELLTVYLVATAYSSIRAALSPDLEYTVHVLLIPDVSLLIYDVQQFSGESLLITHSKPVFAKKYETFLDLLLDNNIEVKISL